MVDILFYSAWRGEGERNRTITDHPIVWPFLIECWPDNITDATATNARYEGNLKIALGLEGMAMIFAQLESSHF